MRSPTDLTRRSALTIAAGTAGTLLTGAALAEPQQPEPKPKRGSVPQSVCRWCFGSFSLDELCKQAKAAGIVGIDLLNENEWETAHKHDLVCTTAMSIGSISDNWNELKNHDRLTQDAERLIPLVAKAGIPNLITFSGNRRGMSDAQGLENCAKGLKRIVGLAEQHKVTIIMELLNSKRDHKDYQCDHTSWGVELCKRVGSERFKLLYDIYHMQIMEGDVCATIRENSAYIAHYHTGGVPGRNEIDDSQELRYPRICQAIVDVGFKGFLAHEFIPRRNPWESLKQAAQICKT